jgi:hypothetical protein
VFHRGHVDAALVPHVAVHADGTRVDNARRPDPRTRAGSGPGLPTHTDFGPTVASPLGSIAGARSGDKGGSGQRRRLVRTDDSMVLLRTR